MYPDLDAVFRKFLSGLRAQRDTAAITQFYRSPGSSGYHAATQFVANAVREAGADEVIEERYPLDGETRFLGRVMPPAWEPLAAVLELDAPYHERLISYEEVPSTLPWWCGGTAAEGVTVELIDVGRGLSLSDYVGKPVAGNAVLIRDSESRPAWAHAADLARQHGVTGIITDFLHSQTPPWRTRQSVPDAVQLLRLPPRWDNPWAFSVSYHVAERLAGLAASGPVRVRANVQVRTFVGEASNVIATLRGTTQPDESVFFIAHTSAGTKPGANCAAGPSLMVELCRAMVAAMRAGDLPRPRRSVRFMFVAEGLGSSHFLHTHRHSLPGIKAALCLDSVGHRQATLYSSLVMYRSPDSVPSHVNDLGAALIEGLPKDADWPFRNGPAISLVNFQELPYTPWSDNHYWVTLGVPALLFMSWPDRYFHTQLLTAEHTDPMVFERAGRVLGSLAVGIARAGADEAMAIMQEVATKSALRVGRLVRDAIQGANKGADLDRTWRRIQHILARDIRALRSALELAGEGAGAVRARALAEELVADLGRRAADEMARIERLVPHASAGVSSSADPGLAAGTIPHRAVDGVSPGVVGLSFEEMGALVTAMQAEDPHANWETLRIFGDELWNWADGRRSVAEIGEAICAEFEFQLRPEHFLTLARGLEKAGQFRLEMRK
jgi:hypothetical protein